MSEIFNSERHPYLEPNQENFRISGRLMKKAMFIREKLARK